MKNDKYDHNQNFDKLRKELEVKELTVIRTHQYNKLMDYIENHFNENMIRRRIIVAKDIDGLNIIETKDEYLFKDELVEEMQEEINNLREKNGQDVDKFIEQATALETDYQLKEMKFKETEEKLKYYKELYEEKVRVVTSQTGRILKLKNQIPKKKKFFLF